MDLEGIIVYDITYMWNLKNSMNESIYKTATDLQIWQQILQLLNWGGSIGLLDYSIILQTTMENKQQGFTV